MTDQQFCLRWNNHQSTLVAVFDGLLEKGVLVDCTLAAEGQQLTAHKVVLAACSPFLETLLSRHYDKHPILILKDVKFSELKAMMDYMYRGEVNISQDQLGTFLKAAESLQIKGLSDGGGNEKGAESHPNKRHHDRKPHRPNSPLRNSLLSDSKQRVPYLHNSVRNSIKSSPLLVDIPEDSPINRPRDGSMSPVPRKKKRPRDSEDVIKSENIPPHDGLNNHQDNSSNSVDLPNSVPRVPSPSESKPSLGAAAADEKNPDKTDPVTHLKHELDEEEDINEDSVELTLDEDELGEAGPSHNDGEFGEFFGGGPDGEHRDGQVQSMPHYLPYLTAKENARLEYERLLMLKMEDSIADSTAKIHSCTMCGRCYKIRSTLNRHIRYECGIARKKLACEICGKKFSRPDNLKQHEQTHVTIYFSGENGEPGVEPVVKVKGDSPTMENGEKVTVAPQIFLIEEPKAFQIQPQQKMLLQSPPVLQKLQLQTQPVLQKIQLQKN